MSHRLIVLSSLVLLASCGSEDNVSRDPAETILRGDSSWNTLTGERPDVIAHRGLSGLFPDHSTYAYRTAIAAGADIIEPDLHVSSDGVLIVRHDPYLSTTTDVADRPEFADRRTERFGQEDWWIADFTAEELQSLNVRQPRPTRDQRWNDQMPVLTFDGFMAIIREEEDSCGCVIPVEPEIKAPSTYALIGLDPLPILLDALDRHGLNSAEAPIVVQSFDAAFLQALDQQTDVRLAMLYSGPDDLTGNASGLSLDEIARFADAIGPNKAVLLNPDGSSTGYLEAAHALGLVVHTWTIRDDETPLVGETVQDELRALYTLGVDGVFTDFPATALRVRDEMEVEN